MVATLEQVYQALALCRALPINFHEALCLVILSDRSLSDAF